MEVLSPQTFKKPEDLVNDDRSCVVNVRRDGLPWLRGEKSRPNHQLYYLVMLGAIPMDRAIEELIRAFGENEEQNRRERERAAIAMLLLDRQGRLLEDSAIAISSFAWALPLALRQQIDGLGRWTSEEPELVEALSERLRQVGNDGMARPLDEAALEDAQAWLQARLELPAELIEPPLVVLRVFQHLKAKGPPELPLLNSFYLADLGRVAQWVAAGNSPSADTAALRRYLGMEPVTKPLDVLADRSVLEPLMAPELMPPARWPAPGGYPLVALQQAAVNAARHELQTSGLIAVNGPPGTGKTTLLRDVVAACVLDRARAMCQFDDPEKAFTASGQQVRTGEAFFHLYRLDCSLRGHEVLVASSNNKAVENISRELPAAKAIGLGTSELSYFKTVSDQLFATEDDAANTWGLITAVLGNGSNLKSFRNNGWWHDECGLRLYLKAAKGDPVMREVRDPKTNELLDRAVPKVVTEEAPPSPEQAKRQWQTLRKKFLAQHAHVQGQLAALEKVRQACVELEIVALKITEQAAMRDRLSVEHGKALAMAQHLEEPVAEALQQRDDMQRALDQHMSTRPGWWAQLLRTRRWKSWKASLQPRTNALAIANEALFQHRKALGAAQKEAQVWQAKLTQAQAELQPLQRRHSQLQQTIAAQRLQLGDRIVDASFFERGHEAWNVTAPWIPDTIHHEREKLFVAAMALHKAFIDASAQKVLHNLSVLMDAMSAGAFKDPAKRALLGDLWSTLFLVVPVVSTTFASVGRMLRDLPPHSIGWLLIDEAGQALPQAAVGAIWRSKRAIVVGDPLQVPPVVALPERLTVEVFKFFQVNADLWAPPEASAQTLADRASKYQASFRSDRGPRRVGLPLLVHRRCQEPMFGVSNRIAYDGQMVHAPETCAPGKVGAVLGPSSWFSVDGEADSKWCPAEGKLLIALLHKLASAGVKAPDLYLITPFRLVAREIRRSLANDAPLCASLEIDPDDWAKNRIGTVHTFQGKEAETVIAILGAPKASQHGARRWAAETPNILNVMVSRAKQNFYVIGSYGAWSSVGHFRDLGRSLPRGK